MDCFYAAIELRERPDLRGKPVAVGGRPGGRGVLTTCNYEARRFGCRSAMPTFQALERCPGLIVLPVRFDLYREESRRIRSIFAEFADLIEPLSLDEAYLDLSGRPEGGAELAAEIRGQIRARTGLTASAGIAPNKLLAKIASDWNKPDGQFEVAPEAVADFVRELPVRRLWGVGGKTAERLAKIGVGTCGDLQRFDLATLHRRFGKFGVGLYEMCRGIDRREVQSRRERKSLSNETTFRADLPDLDAGQRELRPLLDELRADLAGKAGEGRAVRSAFVKVKFADFQQTTAERRCAGVEVEVYEELLEEAWRRGGGKAVRLIGAGVRFEPQAPEGAAVQLGLL